MIRHGYFGHVSPDGRRVGDRVRSVGLRYALAGEVLAWGCGGATPRSAIVAWLRSPGHRAVILDPRYRLLGVGSVAAAPVPCHAGATWTAVFARLL